ncbi:UNVERIFIED_CONTAM: hypothetical protein Sradi_3587800 [Sesamum radiatum]|uniref:Uncharacterized protein n=1 Tax=Sesamum radiatum TaxID=300843 RepID=A0AAW2QHP8_SESRA
MSNRGVDEGALEDFLINLATLYGNDKEQPDTLHSSFQRGKSEDIVSSRKRFTKEELERRRMKDRIVASGTKSFRVFHFCLKQEDIKEIN